MSHLVADNATKTNRRRHEQLRLEQLHNAAGIDIPYQLKQYQNVLESMNKNREIDDTYATLTENLTDTITRYLSGTGEEVEPPQPEPSAIPDLTEHEQSVLKSRIDTDEVKLEQQIELLDRRNELAEAKEEKESEKKDREFSVVIDTTPDPGQHREAEEDIHDIDVKIRNDEHEGEHEHDEPEIQESVSVPSAPTSWRHIRDHRIIAEHIWGEPRTIKVDQSSRSNVVGISVVTNDVTGDNRIKLMRRKADGKYTQGGFETVRASIMRELKNYLSGPNPTISDIEKILSGQRGGAIIPSDGVLIIENEEDAQEQLLKYMGSVASGNDNHALLNYIDQIAQWLWTKGHIDKAQYGEILEFVSKYRAYDTLSATNR